MLQSKFSEITFTDADIVNKDDFIPQGEYNPYKVKPFLLHDHGFAICVVFAEHLQDALDIAVDAGKLDCYAIGEADMGDYPDEDGISFLGNASEPFDIESLGAIELPNPGFSFCALFNNIK